MRLMSDEIADDLAHVLLTPDQQVTARVIDDQLCD
jgi:hypothetical protein